MLKLVKSLFCDWEDLLPIASFLLSLSVAITGICLGKSNYRLALKRRKDDLFDRRYKFMKDFERLWKTTGDEKLGGTRSCLEWDDLLPWAQEAEYLFGKDIYDHIMSYEGKGYDQQLPWVPDPELSKPFHKYLKL